MSFRFLREYGDVHGVDISQETIRLCRRRGVEGLVQGDAMRLPFRDDSFDLILLNMGVAEAQQVLDQGLIHELSDGRQNDLQQVFL